MAFTVFPDLPQELQNKIIAIAIGEEKARCLTLTETFKANDDPTGEPAYGWDVKRPLLPAVIRAIPGALTAAKDVGIIVPLLETNFSLPSLFSVEKDCLHINSKLTINGLPPSASLESGLRDPTTFDLIKRISFDKIDLFYYKLWVQHNMNCFPNLEHVKFFMDIILPLGIPNKAATINIKLEPLDKASASLGYPCRPRMKLPTSGRTVKGLLGMTQLSTDYIPFPQMQVVDCAWRIVESIWKYNKQPYYTLRLKFIKGEEDLERQRKLAGKQANYIKASRNLHARMMLS